MKKWIALALLLVMMLSVAGCAGSDGDSTPEGNYDVDLTKLSSTMAYSEVCNMVADPDDYIGKMVKMSGSFGIYQDDTTNKLYFACLISDATACCSQAIEFVLEGDHSYPEDYPEVNATITVAGVFDTYEENGYTYCQLIDAKMIG